MDASGLDDLALEWCRATLGAIPLTTFFGADSMSSVRGVALSDGRRIALKRRRASDRVLACAQAQTIARQAGIDGPALIAGPSMLEDGFWLSAELWRPEGVPEAPGDAAAGYVSLLRALVSALRGCDPVSFDPPPPWACYDHASSARVWPEVTDARWDPESPIVPGGLRRLAVAARERLTAEQLPLVVGHTDLNGLNVRWAGRPVVHDWDSLAGRPECVLAGILAVNHVELPGVGAITDVAGTRRTLELYQEARTFTSTEIECAWAAGIWVAAYNAAFEHLHGTGAAVSRQLASDGAERLRLAGC